VRGAGSNCTDSGLMPPKCRSGAFFDKMQRNAVQKSLKKNLHFKTFLRIFAL